MKKVFTIFSIFLLVIGFTFVSPKSSEAAWNLSVGVGLGFTTGNFNNSYRGYGGYYSPAYYGYGNTIYPRYGDYGPLYVDNYYSTPGWSNSYSCWTYPCY